MRWQKPDRETTDRFDLSNNLRVLDYVILIVAAVHWPAGVMARNYWQLVHPERVVLLSILISALVCLVARGLVRRSMPRQTVVFTLSLATILVMRGGVLLERFGFFAGWFAIVVLVAGAWWIGRRLAESVVLEVAVVAVAAALALGPLLLALETVGNMGEDEVEDVSLPDFELVTKPDVYLVVVDGYPGLRALGEGLGVAKTEITRDLEDSGFQVPRSAWSGYWSTEMAVPSLLQMGYPVRGGEPNNATARQLHRIIGGASNVREGFARNGYETVMVEAGWAGSACGTGYDRCVASAWLDDLAFQSLWDGVVGRQMLGFTGHAYTQGTLGSMGALLEIAAEESEAPRFVFGHLIAPHPPFFLDSDCETVVSRDRFGDSFLRSGVDVASRKSFFVQQTECVDRFMLELTERVSRDAVVLFVGDHGTDRQKRLLHEGVDDRSAIVERMNVFVAGRVREGCVIPDSMVTVNLMRTVLTCYTDHPVSQVEEEMYLPANVRLGPGSLEELTARG